MKLVIATALWGSWHIDTFFMRCLPTLAHATNIPALRSIVETQWLIYTKPEERPVIETWLGSEKERLGIELRELEQGDFWHYRTAWRAASVEAKLSGALVMYLAPDIAWATWAFHKIAISIKGGMRHMFLSMPRGLVDRFDRPMSAREMIAHCFSQPHPSMQSFEIYDRRFTCHPEMLLWEMKGGYICRMLAREALVCDPTVMGFNTRGLPDVEPGEDGTYIPTKLSEVCGISLAQPDKDSAFYGPLNASDPQLIRKWSDEYWSPTNYWLAKHPVVWDIGRIDDQETDRMIQRSRDYIEAVYA